MAVPFLEVFSPAASLAAQIGATSTKATGATAPVRMAFIFVPNGVNVREWRPEGTGSDYRLSYSLEPLTNVKDEMLVLSGLTHDKGRANGDGAGDHARSASVFLTGAQPRKTSGARIRSGQSVDQVAARALKDKTRFASLELSCDGGRNSGNCDSGYSCAYSNNISWASAATPMAKEVDPRRVFDRLFANELASDVKKNQARRQARRVSILDFVMDDARRLRRRLGTADQRKIDEYFTSIRAIEERLEKSLPRTDQNTFKAPANLPSREGERLSFEDHIRLMSDMMVLAFQGDVTRVATFMYARAGSNRNYRSVDVPDGHHELSHHQSRADKLEKIRRIDRFHVTQLAYFLERLKETKDENGSLLDNSMIVYGSGLSDGNRHNNENLPIVLAGRGGGTIDTGRHVEYPVETPLCNLFVSMLDRVGTQEEAFGDSTGRLPDLTL